MLLTTMHLMQLDDFFHDFSLQEIFDYTCARKFPNNIEDLYPRYWLTFYLGLVKTMSETDFTPVINSRETAQSNVAGYLARLAAREARWIHRFERMKELLELADSVILHKEPVFMFQYYPGYKVREFDETGLNRKFWIVDGFSIFTIARNIRCDSLQGIKHPRHYNYPGPERAEDARNWLKNPPKIKCRPKKFLESGHPVDVATMFIENAPEHGLECA